MAFFFFGQFFLMYSLASLESDLFSEATLCGSWVALLMYNEVKAKIFGNPVLVRTSERLTGVKNRTRTFLLKHGSNLSPFLLYLGYIRGVALFQILDPFHHH